MFDARYKSNRDSILIEEHDVKHHASTTDSATKPRPIIPYVKLFASVPDTQCAPANGDKALAIW